MDTTIAALIGALLGATASLGGMFIQQYFQNKRDLLRMATDIATSDYKSRMELMKNNGGKLPPISAYVHYHVEVLNLMAKGKFTPEAIQRLNSENSEILKAYMDLSK